MTAGVHAQFGVLGLATMALACGSLPEARSPSEGVGLRYEAAIAGDASVLVVEAAVPRGMPPYFGVAAGALPFVRALHVSTDGRSWSPVGRSDTFFFVPECEDGCRFRYQFSLREAARTLRDVDRATVLASGVYEAPPSSWLLRPIGQTTGVYSLRVLPTGDANFATGLFATSEQTWAGDLAQLGQAPYTVFGRFELDVLRDVARGISLQVLVPAALHDRKPSLLRWVERSARAVADYYAQFPVPRALVVVAPRRGDAVTHGRTVGNGGAATIVWVGDDVDDDDLASDWVLPHELVHMALPGADEQHRWFEEGVATYVEKVARIGSGDLAEEAFWRELLDGLPKGLPHRGDRGLDQSPTWGRRYWGGALFCFLADVEIRRRTGGRFTLADALRGIVHAGGNIAVAWDLKRTLQAGDAATGVPVLRELYERMGARPMPVDLAAVWSRLGVSWEGGRVVLDDAAPASRLRRSFRPARGDD